MPVPGLPLKPQLTRLVVGGPLASLVLAAAGFVLAVSIFLFGVLGLEAPRIYL